MSTSVQIRSSGSQQRGLGLVAVVAEAASDAAAHLPLARAARLGRVLRRADVGVQPAAGDGGDVEAVVDDAVRDGGVVPGEDVVRVEPPRPADVVPQRARGEPLDQLVDVGGGVLGVLRCVRHRGDQRREIGDRRRKERPVEPAGVVHAEAQASGSCGIGELPDVVALGHPAVAVRVRCGAAPHQEAVVVLGHRHHVARPGAGEQRDPVGHRRATRPLDELADEVGVRGVAVGRRVVLGDRAAGDRPRVQVPLGVRGGAERIGPVAVLHHLAHVVGQRGEARHRVRPPVDEDPQLGVVVPPGQRAVGERHRAFNSPAVAGHPSRARGA